MTANVGAEGEKSDVKERDERPRVVHCRREPYDLYIGRAMPRQGLAGSKWANPYRIGKDGDRWEVIEKYRLYIEKRPDLMAALPELEGLVLGCWCKPDACHGDVLLELAALRSAAGAGGE